MALAASIVCFGTPSARSEGVIITTPQVARTNPTLFNSAIDIPWVEYTTKKIGLVISISSLSIAQERPRSIINSGSGFSPIGGPLNPVVYDEGYYLPATSVHAGQTTASYEWVRDDGGVLLVPYLSGNYTSGGTGDGWSIEISSTLLGEGESVGPSSSFTESKSDLSGGSYLGFKYTVNSSSFYGWLGVHYDGANGEVTFDRAAMNTTAGATIFTGQTAVTAVPEIDPATGSSALSLVAGVLAMIEQRRRRAAIVA